MASDSPGGGPSIGAFFLLAVAVLALASSWWRVPAEESLGTAQGVIAKVEVDGYKTPRVWVHLKDEEGAYRISPPFDAGVENIRRWAMVGRRTELRYVTSGDDAGAAFAASFDGTPYYTYEDHVTHARTRARWGRVVATLSFVGALWCIRFAIAQSKARKVARLDVPPMPHVPPVKKRKYRRQNPKSRNPDRRAQLPPRGQLPRQ